MGVSSWPKIPPWMLFSQLNLLRATGVMVEANGIEVAAAAIAGIGACAVMLQGFTQGIPRYVYRCGMLALVGIQLVYVYLAARETTFSTGK